MKRHGNWVKWVLWVWVGALGFGVGGASWSKAAEDDGEYSFSWLDPDKKVSVLQNRRYRKANRALISLSAGMADSNAYRKSYAFDPRLAYYFSEAWGIEAFYSSFSNSKNATAEALESTAANAAPDVIEVKNQLGILLHWVPWYAKINVFNSVLYFDWYFSGGVGSMNANMIPGSASISEGSAPNTKSLTAFFLGTGNQFYVNEHLVVRLDFRNAWFKAPKRAVKGDEIYFNSTTFQVGLGWLL